MVNPLDIYARATRRLPLTPAERALLKTVDQLGLSALAGALLAVAQTLLAGGQQLTLATIGQVALYAAATALVTGAAKLFRARGDALGTAVASALDQAETRLPAPGSLRAYRGVPSGPISAEQRAAIMQAARQTVASNPQLGVVTPRAPVAAPAADVAATQTSGAQTTSDTPTAQISLSARSTGTAGDQPAAAALDQALGDGPGSQVTQVMPVMRAPVMGTAVQTADTWTVAG